MNVGSIIMTSHSFHVLIKEVEARSDVKLTELEIAESISHRHTSFRLLVPYVSHYLPMHRSGRTAASFIVIAIAYMLVTRLFASKPVPKLSR